MFTEEVRSIIVPGCALVVGTVGDDGLPRTTRAWSIEPLHADTRLRIVMSADDEVAVGHLVPGRWVAVTGSDVTTLKSLQFKGPVVTVEATNAHDDEAFAAGCAGFLEKVSHTDGTSASIMRRMLPQRTIAFELEVEQLFDQSPGPAAGRPLRIAG